MQWHHKEAATTISIFLSFDSGSFINHWNSCVGAGGASALQKRLDLPKIRANLANQSKIPENPGKNGAQRCLTLKNGVQRLQKNT